MTLLTVYTDGDAPERVSVALVSPNTLTMLGVRPILGQLFEQGDTSWSNTRSAILISENLWRRRYGAGGRRQPDGLFVTSAAGCFASAVRGRDQRHQARPQAEGRQVR